MSFIRPEIQTAAIKYREPLFGAALGALGLYVALTSGGVLSILGATLIVIAAAMAALSLRRIRLQADHIGLGVVEVTEREIAYLSPYNGGAVSIENLASVTVRNAQGPQSDLYWMLEDTAGTSLAIPNSATGADALLDGLAALPGVDFDAATRALSSKTDETIVIWSKAPKRLH